MLNIVEKLRGIRNMIKPIDKVRRYGELLTLKTLVAVSIIVVDRKIVLTFSILRDNDLYFVGFGNSLQNRDNTIDRTS